MKPTPTRGTDQILRRIPGRRERRKLATRDALLDAARSLLVSRSMDALGVDEIVERADVAHGTFYNYFADKDALERELASQSRARIEGEIARVNEGVIDPAERIARAFLSVLHLGISAPQQATAIMRLFPRATDPAAPINAGSAPRCRGRHDSRPDRRDLRGCRGRVRDGCFHGRSEPRARPTGGPCTRIRTGTWHNSASWAWPQTRGGGAHHA